MKLGKFSKALILFVIWGLATSFLLVKAYDLGYQHGLERATEIFLTFGK